MYDDRGNVTILQGQREGYNCTMTEGMVQLCKDRGMAQFQKDIERFQLYKDIGKCTVVQGQRNCTILLEQREGYNYTRKE